jgi:hypothetical protein
MIFHKNLPEKSGIPGASQLIDHVHNKCYCARRIGCKQSKEPSMSMIGSKCGTVRWVPQPNPLTLKPTKGKSFGFIRPTDRTINDGNDLFFPFGTGRTYSIEEGKIVWRRGIEKIPEREDRVLFGIGRNYKGPMASPWSYAANYEEVCRTATVPLTYRVTRRSRLDRLDSPLCQIVWEGTNLDELAWKHPRTGDRWDDFPLPQYTRAEYLFGVENGREWETIPDPRPLIKIILELAPAAAA